IAGAALELIIFPLAQRRLGGAAAVGRALAFLAVIVATATPLLLGVVPGVAVTGSVAIALVAAALVRRTQRPHVTPTSAA
ncbi:MAG: hypothetical protein Q8M65_00850, partial [Rhodoglobus sp.]|nr:hypothetical protein [Rhodoglobus sp.]